VKTQRVGSNQFQKKSRVTIGGMSFAILIIGITLHYTFVGMNDLALKIIPSKTIVTANPSHGPMFVETAYAETVEEIKPPTEGWDAFVEAVHKVAPMYNFPENVVLAQGALESAHGNSHFAKTRNNFLGIGAFDSNPDDAYTFENPEQCVIEYMRTIKRNFPEAWDQRENPEKVLELIKNNSQGRMYATDPNYVAKVKSMKEWN